MVRSYDTGRTAKIAEGGTALSPGWISQSGFNQEKRLGRSDKKRRIERIGDCTSLAEYWKSLICQACLKDEEGLEEAGYDVLKSMSREHVCYAEIRFAPLFSETESMSCKRAMEALIKGLERGKQDFNIEYGVIACAMRHIGRGRELADDPGCKRTSWIPGVCGADLAGAEASYPMSQFMNLFENTRKIGMPFTIHAGECGSVDNITDAVNVGAKRIGHGIAMRGHEDVIRELAEKKIGIEMCPISNLQTKAVSGPEFYPIREFLDHGALVTVNTDNRTVSNTTMTKELEFIQKTYGVRDEEVLLLMRNAVDAAFASDTVKEKLYRKLAEK